jgi:hypothetical protein
LHFIIERLIRRSYIKKIALYGDDLEANDLIEVLTEGHFNLEVQTFKKVEVLEKVLKAAPDSFIAIFTTNQTQAITQTKLYLINNLSLNLPFVYILAAQKYERADFDSFFSDNSFNFVLPKEQISKELINTLNQILKKYKEGGYHGDNYEKDGRKLFAIRALRVLDSSTAKSDLFVKIGDQKFIKVIQKDQPVDKALIERIIKKGGKYLYQDEEDYKEQVKMMITNLGLALKKDDLDSKNRMVLELKTIKEVQDAVRNMGITEEVIQTTDEIVKSIEIMVQTNKELSPFINKLLSAKSTIFTRTAIANYFLGGIYKKVDWMTYESFKKLIYSSIFCDFSFAKEDEKLAFILSLENPAYLELNATQKSKVKSHSFRSASIIEKHKDFLTDEVNIITHHHEHPDGTGFPNGLDYKRTPILTCIFILVYDFSNKLVLSTANKEDLDAVEVFKSLPANYKLGNYNKGYLALEKILKII